ncbi:protein of unknown function [Clostridium beijerinckii]|nr:protein of unknown function [Clostridium beijerinckii]
MFWLKTYISRKIIIHHNSKNIARILGAIVNYEMCIVNCSILFKENYLK